MNGQQPQIYPHPLLNIIPSKILAPDAIN